MAALAFCHHVVRTCHSCIHRNDFVRIVSPVGAVD